MSTKFEELNEMIKVAIGVQTGQPSLGVPGNTLSPLTPPTASMNPAAQTVGQPAPAPSSVGAGPAVAPAVQPQTPGSVPPAAQGAGALPGSPDAAVEAAQQQADAAKLQAEQEAEQAKVEETQYKARAQTLKSLTGIEEAKVDVAEEEVALQEALAKTQQYEQAMGQPIGQPAEQPAAQPAAQQAAPPVQKIGSRFQQMQQRFKLATRKPLTAKQAGVKVALHAAKVRKYNEHKQSLSDASAMAEVLMRDIPSGLIKQGFELDPLTDTDPRLTVFGLKTAGCGRMIDMINQRQHGRAKVEKVAAGDMEAYRDVLRRGTALHRAIVKMAGSIFATVEDVVSEADLELVDYVVKLAADRIQPKSLVMRQFAAIVADRNVRKTASVAMASKKTSAQAAESIKKAAAIGGKVGAKVVNTIMISQPVLRKMANIAIFDAAGAAALVNNDTDTLARCVLGLALESRLGDKAYELATS